MNNSKVHQLRTITTMPLFIILILTWSVGIGAALIFNVHKLKEGTVELARIQARAFFNKDLLYRKWNASHGGVYVPVTDTTLPNKYLKVSDRDIVTESGRKLTLMNPAYMTRQIHEIAAMESGIKGHITSLNLIRPGNRPDAWEADALELFKKDIKEVSSIVNINGAQYLRLMRPLITEQGCLKCHAEQGYQLGDIRGGISVSVPLLHFITVTESNRAALLLGHFFLWMFGLCGLTYSYYRIKNKIGHEYGLAQDALTESEKKYRLLADNAADVIYKIDLETEEVTYASPSVKRLLGYTVIECLSLKGKDILTPESYKHQQGKLTAAVVERNTSHAIMQLEVVHKDGRIIPVEVHASIIMDEQGKPVEIIGATRDITKRKKAQESLLLEKEKLQKALAEVKQLSGLLPICSSCKKIRDDKGYWNNLESYIHAHSEAEFSHGMCPECSEKLYGKEDWYIKMQKDKDKAKQDRE